MQLQRDSSGYFGQNIGSKFRAAILMADSTHVLFVESSGELVAVPVLADGQAPGGSKSDSKSENTSGSSSGSGSRTGGAFVSNTWALKMSFKLMRYFGLLPWFYHVSPEFYHILDIFTW